MSVKVTVWRWWPFGAATTVSKRRIICSKPPDPDTLEHEMVHVADRREMGDLLFNLRYVFVAKWRARMEFHAYATEIVRLMEGQYPLDYWRDRLVLQRVGLYRSSWLYTVVPGVLIELVSLVIGLLVAGWSGAVWSTVVTPLAFWSAWPPSKSWCRKVLSGFVSQLEAKKWVR